MRKRVLTSVGVWILALFILAAALAPWIAPHPPNQTDVMMMLEPPGPDHWMGTDDIGRDVLSRLLYAGRASLTLGIGTAALAVAMGSLLGALAGYFGRWVDTAISAAIDALLSIPTLALAMVIGAFVELTPWRLVVILASLSWTEVARIVRGQVLSVKEWSFVEAVRACGASEWRILFRHVLPNAYAPALVAGTLLAANAILIESALSFLGFGVPPPTATWGGMLHVAQAYVWEAPWLAIFPGLAITLVVAAINFVGERLQGALDPVRSEGSPRDQGARSERGAGVTP